MTELSFAKAFLSSLDPLPVKLPADHVSDPRDFPLRHPFTLPRLSDRHPPMPKKIKPAAIPGLSKSITVHLKSARNPVLDVKLDNVALDTATIQELKEAVQERIETKGESGESAKVPLEKIKILFKRKPVQAKTVAEAVGNEVSGGGDVEFGVMVLGGATLATVPPKAEKQQPGNAESDVVMQETGPEAESSSSGILSKDAFWDDLETFLGMKIKDSNEASRLRSLFKGAWESTR